MGNKITSKEIMNKEELEQYRKLEQKLTKEAHRILVWYHKNVHHIYDIENFEFDCVKDDLIFYEGWVCGEPTSFTLSATILFMSDEELIEFAIQEKEALAKAEEERLTSRREKKEAAKKRLYLKLKGEYEER